MSSTIITKVAAHIEAKKIYSLRLSFHDLNFRLFASWLNFFDDSSKLMTFTSVFSNF